MDQRVSAIEGVASLLAGVLELSESIWWVDDRF